MMSNFKKKWVTILCAAAVCTASVATATLSGVDASATVAQPSSYFKDWNSSTATYKADDYGVWCMDNATTSTNRQAPVAESFDISSSDAYLEFAIPVYDAEGVQLSDKLTTNVDMVLVNAASQEMRLRFMTGDGDHAKGINMVIAYTPSGWCEYWTTTRLPGDFTADNTISVKFSKTAGSNLQFKNAAGEWYTESAFVKDDVASFFDTSSISVNFLYWVESASADTNLAVVLKNINGTSLLPERAPEVTVGGTEQTVEVTAPTTYFEYDWNKDTATYGVTENGVWRKDSFAGEGNRQVPLKEPLTISSTKDAYITFALPVYGSDGTLLADKTTTDIIFILTNDAGEELQIKFLPADENHANGINYCVSKTPKGGWTSYWCQSRIPGDFTADNFITLRFGQYAGYNIMTKDAEGNWYADKGVNTENVADFFANATTLKINVMYWASAATSDTNLEMIVKNIDGTTLTKEQVVPVDGYILPESTPKAATFNGYTYTIPAAKGVFGEEKVDADVKVSKNGENVTLDGNTFVAATGEYTITYTAVYEENTAEKTYAVKVYTGEKVTDVPTNADDYFRGWISGPSYWDENGLTSIDNSGASSAAQRQSCYQADYVLTDDLDLTMTVSIPIYDQEGNKLENRLNHTEDGIDNLDLIIIDIDTGKEFRIRMVDSFSVKEETTFFGAYYSGDPYASAENYNGWISRYADTKIKGTFTAESSFTFKFTNQENAHMQVIAPNGTWKVVGDAADATDETSLNKALNTFFKDVTNIRVNFYYWATPAVASAEDNLAVTYKEINGQSLVPVEGKIVDETVPVVGEVITPKTSEFKTGSDYVFNVTYVSEIFENVNARKLVYRQKGDTEWIETGAYDKDSFKLVGCRFEKYGTLEVAVKVVDTTGNVGYGAITEIIVEKGYDITVNGDVPTSGVVGQKIELPSATASDKTGTTRDVTISVEDSAGRTVEMDSANSFTPSKAGTYYVIYKSSYTDDSGKTVSTKAEYTVTVTASSGTDTPSDSKDNNSTAGGCSSAFGCGVGIVLTLASAAVVLRKKRND